MKLLMLSNYSDHNKCVMEATLKNHLDYCCKWGIDCMYTTGTYSPHNDFHQLYDLLCPYDRVITVGTDILFTDMKKDIRDFCSDHFIVIQEQQTGAKEKYFCNGDFIIWNSKYKQYIDKLQEADKKYINTQQTISRLAQTPEWETIIKCLPPSTIQSMCPWERKSLQKYFWKQGDFSVHCYTSGVPPRVQTKMRLIEKFKREHFELF